MPTELAGVIVAAIGGFVVARYQGAREDKYRFAADKRTTYAEFIRACRQHHKVLEAHIDARNRGDAPTEELGSTEDINQLWSEIAMLSASPVWNAAYVVYTRLMELGAFAWDATRPPPHLHGDVELNDLPAMIEAYNSALGDFFEAAKADIGTGPGFWGQLVGAVLDPEERRRSAQG